MISLFKMIKIELIKTSKLRVFSLLFLLPIFITLFGVYINHEQIANGYWVGSNFWRLYFNYMLWIYGMLLPIIQCVIANVQMGIEFKGNAFQMLYTLPVRRSRILFSKLVIHILYTFFFLLWAFALMLLSGTILLQIYPDPTFLEYDFFYPILLLFVQLLVASITIGIIHLCISYCNVTSQISILMASFATILSIFATNWTYVYIIPYAWIFKCTQNFSLYEEMHLFSPEMFAMMVYATIFVIITLLINKRKKIFTLWV